MFAGLTESGIFCEFFCLCIWLLDRALAQASNIAFAGVN